ncbi:MAG: hypothetical protein E7474_01360 [Ruminococcaceae bacterium]|nr:hypothetical protein [Oscillospiraceae bacterium]
MEEQELEQIVRQVVAELARRQGGAEDAIANDGRAKVLVVGAPDAVPERLRADAVLCPLAEYEASRNICRYDRVVIAELTLLQLVDAALGRPGDAACCALVSALLAGKEVDLVEAGLPHRAYAGKGSTGLYARIEGYVRTLQGYGVKLWSAERLAPRAEPPAKPAKFAPPPAAVPTGSAKPNGSRVVTEAVALELTARGADTVTLPRGAIVTPSARDVFAQAHVTVQTEDGTR